MSEPITKPLLGDAIETAAAQAAHLPPAQLAKQIRAAVLSDPDIAKATKPIARIGSQVYQGAAIPVVAAAVVIAAKWAGYELDANEVITVLTGAILVGAAFVDYGRRHGSRPISGWFSSKR